MADEDDIEPQDESKATAESSQKAETTEPPSDKQDESLRATAERFLQDAKVESAPVEEKRRFLISKGLGESEVSNLLDGGLLESQESKSQERSDNFETDTPPPPPVITYPEFLLHSQKPPPLVTLPRLLTAAYGLTGAATVVYGTSRYLVEPMLESLESSRHAILTTASSALEALNGKLCANVSTVPARATHGQDGEVSESESTTIDGARYFSKTAATQTSPDSSPSPSETLDSADKPAAASARQEAQLTQLQQRLQDVKLSSDREQTLQLNMEELRGFLNLLPHVVDPAQASHSSGLGKGGEGDDGVSRLKGDIRSVKGVLLNARNFPSTIGR